MSTKLISKEKSLVTLQLSVSVEDFKKALQAAYKKNAQRFSVPGFRKGKVPYALAMNYYGETALYEDAIDLALNPAYKEAIDEHKLEPVARPDMDVLEIGSDKGLTVEFKITVKPEVTLGKYKGVKAEKPAVSVTEEDVDRDLQQVRERSGRMVPVEGRAAELGDTAKIDFEGFLDGVAFDGGKGEGYDLNLGSGTFIPGFEEQIVGHEVGDSFDVNVTFPEDYGAAELAGKAVVFKVTLHSLTKKELPELDDEFAKDVSEFDTLAEFRSSIQQKLQEQAEKRAKSVFENNVVQAVVETCEVELPAAMVEQEIESTLAQQAQSMKYQGIELNQYLQYLGKSLVEYREDLRPECERKLRTSLVLEAISKAEALPVSEEDVEAEFDRLAKQYGMKVEDVKSRFGTELDYMKDDIRIRKTVEWLTEQAKATTPKAKKEKTAKKD